MTSPNQFTGGPSDLEVANGQPPLTEGQRALAGLAVGQEAGLEYDAMFAPAEGATDAISERSADDAIGQRPRSVGQSVTATSLMNSKAGTDLAGSQYFNPPQTGSVYFNNPPKR